MSGLKELTARKSWRLSLGPVTFGMVYQGRRQKKNYPAVEIHPGKFEDKPGKFWLAGEKFLRFVLKFSRMYFYSRIIFFLTPTLVNHAKSDWPRAHPPWSPRPATPSVRTSTSFARKLILFLRLPVPMSPSRSPLLQALSHERSSPTLTQRQEKVCCDLPELGGP